MSLQASVHARQAPAQTWQCSASCVEHNLAQASHTNAHNVHDAVANSPSLASIAAQRRHTSAQSVHRLMQCFMRVAFSSRQAAAHWSHATAHS